MDTNNTTDAPGGLRDATCSAVLESHEEWDDTKFRHAYFPKDPVAMCGYDGERTWKNEASPPANLCPICAAIYPEYWDGSKWISLPNDQGEPQREQGHE